MTYRSRCRAFEKLAIVLFIVVTAGSLSLRGFIGIAHADEVSAVLAALGAADQDQDDQAVAPGKVKGGTGDPCLDAVPLPTVKDGLHRVVQLVNCSQREVMLGAANAAEQLGGQQLPVLPREGTWQLQQFRPSSKKNANILTIDIPLGWENTACPNGKKVCDGIIGPRFWTRTGCRYDVPFDIAQCETGGCSGRYDCSAARLSSTVGTTISEWTFAEPVINGEKTVTYLKDSPDISAVDGTNVNLDIQPVGGTPHDPFDTPPDWSLPDNPPKGHDPQWLAEQFPLTVHGEDLRTNGTCNDTGANGCCPDSFRLRRSDLTNGKPFGFVIVDKPGHPRSGDATVACFSNCAKYEYPQAPTIGCNESDPNCFNWESFCLGDPSKYGKACMFDSDCPVGGSCWDDPGSATDHTCQGRAFIKGSSCPDTVCTYPYGYIDTVTDPVTVYHSTQPPFGNCTLITGDTTACIGDDTVHTVLPKAYTWPNDPQVYGGDAPVYRVIFEPGGDPQKLARISSNAIPMCNNLPPIYGYSTQYGGPKSGTKPCDNPVNLNGAIFAVANANPHGKKDPTGVNDWACDPDPTGSNNQGVMCRWNPVNPIQQVGLRWNFNSGGSDLELHVVPGVKNNDLLLASITYNSAATATPPSGWTQVPNASVVSNADDQTVVWYHVVGTTAEPPSYTWTWNGAVAGPAGGITAWRGVSKTTPFDVPAVVATGTGLLATAPVITTLSANAQLISVFGSGGATGLSFALPANESGAVKVNGGPQSVSWYAHLLSDKPQRTVGATLPQSVILTTVPPAQTGNDWTAISFALKPTKGAKGKVQMVSAEKE